METVRSGFVTYGMNAEASVERWYRPERPAYRGVYCQQFEDDLARYVELIGEFKPQWILEVGRAEGGTTMLLADRLGDVNPTGTVISVDIELPTITPATRARTVYLTGDSLSNEVVDTVRRYAVASNGMVLLDGDHNPGQVIQELDLYAPMADYLIVEDTIMRHLGNQIGPHIALDSWLPNHPEFVPDPDPTLTQHPGGWLRRI